jgi:putative ABC transport system permease protein
MSRSKWPDSINSPSEIPGTIQSAPGRDGGTVRFVRFVLIAGQLAAASVLLVGSALLGRSYLNLMSVDAGFNERTRTLTVAHDPNIPVPLRQEVVDRTLTALRRAGGVTAVGASAGQLLDGGGVIGGILVDGRMVVPPPDVTRVTGDYFSAMGLQFIAGGAPAPGTADAAVVTEGAARELFGGRAPVGAVLWRNRDLRVVGVVRDVRSRRLSVPPRPGVYVPADSWPGSQPQATYVLRVADGAAPVASWERIVRDVDPLAVVVDGGTIRDRLDRSVRDRTFAALVIGLFAVATLLVAVLGLAGVVAYTVVRRTREIAIRLLLGATADRVTTLVVRDALTAATSGVAGGVIASLWLSRALESLLYGIPATDAMTFAWTAAVLLGAALGAAVLPGIRAARIPAASALRSE